jgi:hypothetical protein
VCRSRASARGGWGHDARVRRTRRVQVPGVHGPAARSLCASRSRGRGWRAADGGEDRDQLYRDAVRAAGARERRAERAEVSLGCVVPRRLPTQPRAECARAEHQNFNIGDIVLLTDDVADPRVRPTRENVLSAMHWLVRDARPDDSIFFHCLSPCGRMRN